MSSCGWLFAALLAFSICKMLSTGDLALPTLIGTWIDCFSLTVPEECYGPEMSKIGAYISVKAEIASTIYW